MNSPAQVQAPGLRSKLRLWALFCDVALAAGSYKLVLMVFASLHYARFQSGSTSFDWDLVVTLVALVGSFAYGGLYTAEAWASRPLHTMTLLKGTALALVIAAFIAFTFKAPLVSDSRFAVFSAFGLFFVLDACVRVGLIDRIYQRDLRERPGVTVVVGFDSAGSILASRLKELRGYGRILALQPLDRRRNSSGAEPSLLWAIKKIKPAPRQVFIDGPSLGHKAAFDLIAAGQARGADVYLAGRLANQLDTTHLLLRLFELPVARVHRHPSIGSATRTERAEHVFKRTFDVAASALALAMLAPAFAVIAVLIKRDSQGPAFFRQQRVGLDGATFEFLKFRSMKVDGDESTHHDYVLGLIETGAVASYDEQGIEVYKLVADDRVTHVGRFLRKWSLDELPQFWNVLRGDMSIIGPRPALGYEVAAYKPWHRLRLGVTPGVSGLWQIAGRSRVSFDEMVFQDVMYTYNQSLLTDVVICARTVPAVLMGRGAA